MPRLIEEGQPFEELVKGSLDYGMYKIRKAFYDAFPRCYYSDECEWFECQEIFSDHVIVWSRELPDDEYYMVPFTVEGDDYNFTERDDWEIVELSYRPQTKQESFSQMSEDENGESLVAMFSESATTRIKEENMGNKRENRRKKKKRKNTLAMVESDALTGDVVNKNRRLYPSYLIQEAVIAASEALKERPNTPLILGELDHPSSKGNKAGLLSETAIIWDEIEFDSRTGKALMSGSVLDTAAGRDFYAFGKAEVETDTSVRVWGISKIVEDDDGEPVELLKWISFENGGLDPVTSGSDPNAKVTYIGENAPDGANHSAQARTGSGNENAAESAKNNVSIGDNNMPTGKDVKNEAATQPAQPTPQPAVSVQENRKDMFSIEKFIDFSLKDSKLSERTRINIKEKAMKNPDITTRNAEQITTDLILEVENLLDDHEKSHNSALKKLEEEKNKLEEEKRQAAIKAELESVTNNIAKEGGYTKAMANSFRDVMSSYEYAKVEDVSERAKTIRVSFDEQIAERNMERRGFAEKHGITMIGEVLENETGYPEFARLAYEINESYSTSQGREMRTLNQKIESSAANSGSMVYAKKYVEKYFKMYGHKLKQENDAYRRLSEASQTGDLSLPYTVGLAGIVEAIPQLVSPSVFDFGTINSSNERLWYEFYEAEVGAEITLAANGATATTVVGTPVQLVETATPTNIVRSIRNGSVIVRNVGGGVTYAEGTDYVINYEQGEITALAAGAIGAAVVEVELVYDKIRVGEGGEIERAKATLVPFDVVAEADRLSTNIRDEAMKFSSSQLNYDLLNRTIGLLVREIRERIDRRVFAKAMEAVQSVPLNSTPAWVGGTNTPEEMVDRIGDAIVLVRNRFWTPTAVVASPANAEIITRYWHQDRFSRGDMSMTSDGYVRDVKGLSLFQTTQFRDDVILVVDRNLVMHRVYSPMELSGPFPEYGPNGKLIATDQYYVQEYNTTDAPVLEKGAWIPVQ